MNPCFELVDLILGDIKDLIESPINLPDFRSEAQFIPPSISTEAGFVFISPAMGNRLASLAEKLLDIYFQKHKADFASDEWNGVVRRALGSILDSYSEEAPPQAREVLTRMVENIRGNVERIPRCTYAFGCHFFGPNFARPVTIGPARFDPRTDWLERIQSEGIVSKTAKSRLEKTWKGERLRKRRSSNDSYSESSIRETIGECAFVCSVEVGAKGTEMGLHKALIGARLSMTAVALAWQFPSSALKHMNLIYDRQVRDRNYFVSVRDGRTGGGSSITYLPGGPRGIDSDEWHETETFRREIFDCAGEVVRFITDDNGGGRPKMMDALYQSLFWFHEACREEIDSVAVMKFVSSMDALALGKKENGIRELVKVRLNFKEEEVVRKDIAKLYRGRSTSVHGTNKEMKYDWSRMRVIGEYLARACLITCLEWAAQHPDCDDPNLLSK